MSLCSGRGVNVATVPSMRNPFTWQCSLVLCLVAGCGFDFPEPRVTFDLRTSCQGLDDALIEAILNTAETSRDSLTRDEAFSRVISSCVLRGFSNLLQCIDCGSAVVDRVWGVTLESESQGQGTVEGPSGILDRGDVVTLRAVPADGWRFDRWEGDIEQGAFDHWADPQLAPANPANLVLLEDLSLTAIFEPKQIGSETFDLGNGVTLTVVEIPAGVFLMGSTQEERDAFIEPGLDFNDESPQREVTVSTFSMSETEVTQAQFQTLMGFVPNIPADCQTDCFEIALGDDFPAAWVDWVDAVEFADRLSERTGRACRLPTEAEWEYACRAGSDAAFTFGDDTEQLNDYAWFGRSATGERFEPVAQKLPNTLGLFDMHGNVWEWVGDWWDSYPSESEVDPTGPRGASTPSRHKIARGGAYSRIPFALRSAYRFNGSQNAQFNFGFRVVCE